MPMSTTPELLRAARGLREALQRWEPTRLDSNPESMLIEMTVVLWWLRALDEPFPDTLMSAITASPLALTRRTVMRLRVPMFSSSLHIPISAAPVKIRPKSSTVAVGPKAPRRPERSSALVASMNCCAASGSRSVTGPS